MHDLISRQAAIDAICDNCDTVKASCPHYPCSRYVAVEKLPSVQPEPCEDPIERQAAIDAFEKELCDVRAFAVGFVGAKRILESVPSAQPEQPEIIRCKDCIFGHLYLDVHNETNIDSWVECINPDGLNRDVSCDGYCSAAIRRKNNEDY